MGLKSREIDHLLIRQLKLTANKPVTKPALLRTVSRWAHKLISCYNSSIISIYSPDTVLSPLPFRSSVQYLTRWSKAPERGLVNALDRSLPMDQSLFSLLQGYSNALQTSDYRPSSFIKLAGHTLYVADTTYSI